MSAIWMFELIRPHSRRGPWTRRGCKLRLLMRGGGQRNGTASLTMQPLKTKRVRVSVNTPQATRVHCNNFKVTTSEWYWRYERRHAPKLGDVVCNPTSSSDIGNVRALSPHCGSHSGLVVTFKIKTGLLKGYPSWMTDYS